VKEARPGDVRDGRSHLLTCVNDIHTEGVDSIPPNIVAINARDENLSLVIVHEKSTNHFAIVF
jgi:hypothetical protein